LPRYSALGWDLAGFIQSWLTTVRIPKLARTGKFGPSGFFFHRARRILFRQDEKEWGVHPPRRKSAAAKNPTGEACDHRGTIWNS